MGGDPPGNLASQGALAALVETNVLVRYLTGDPPSQASAADAFLRSTRDLLVPDLVFAEVVYVLSSFYGFARDEVAERMRAALSFSGLVFIDRNLLSRSLEIYEKDRLDYAESYLVALAEATGVGQIASFDKAIDKIGTVRRLEPKRPRGAANGS